jgi:hypothetical protein
MFKYVKNNFNKNKLICKNFKYFCCFTSPQFFLFISSFLNRHEELFVSQLVHYLPELRDLTRQKFMTFLISCRRNFKKYNFAQNSVFNVDETGLTVVEGKIPHVVGHKGKRQIGALTSAERGSWLTVIACMRAKEFVPPLVIFPKKNMSQILMKGVSSRSIIGI